MRSVQSNMDQRIAAILLILVCSACLSLSNAKVQVQFYGESLCPYCRNFTATVIEQVVASGLSDYMNYTFVPYGNARYNETSGEIQCQHGPLECAVNKLLSCGIAHSTSQASAISYTSCIEAKVSKTATVNELVSACPGGTDPDGAKVLACYEGDEGNDLQRIAYETTAALYPPHKWVPWVVVEGIPLLDDIDQLATYICVAIQGKKPDACYEPATRSRLAGTAAHTPSDLDGAEPAGRHDMANPRKWDILGLTRWARVDGAK